MPNRLLAASAVLASIALIGLLGCASGANRPAGTSTGNKVMLRLYQTSPPSQLIVLSRSIGGVRMGESRRAIVRLFGHYTSLFGGRLQVSYVFHVRRTKRVQSLETTWPGFHTASGIHVGSPRAALGAIRSRVECTNTSCGVDLPAKSKNGWTTIFWLRHERVSRIQILTVY